MKRNSFIVIVLLAMISANAQTFQAKLNTIYMLDSIRTQDDDAEYRTRQIPYDCSLCIGHKLARGNKPFVKLNDAPQTSITSAYGKGSIWNYICKMKSGTITFIINRKNKWIKIRSLGNNGDESVTQFHYSKIITK